MVTTARRTLVAGVAAGLLISGIAASPAVAVTSDGPAYTWGDNALGQLGDSTVSSRFTPGPISGQAALTQAAGGRGHVLGRRADGTVLAWGSNEFGQVGDGTITNRRNPVALSGLPTVTEVSTGHYHSLAVGTDGSLWAWGYNAFGQLGTGTTTNAARPTRSLLTQVVSAVGGREHSLALRSDGSVWAWGSNADGEVGDGTTTRRLSPVPVTGLPAVVGIAAARNTSYAWTASGSLYAWGRNDYGQAGVGDTASRSRPALVSLPPVTDVSAGAFHVVALTTDGRVFAWGFNSYGNVGDGTSTRRLSPVVVAGLASISSVGTGRDHSMAVTSGGALFAWGRNDFGQLGDGTRTNRSRPVPVAGLEGVTEVSGGRDYTVASTAVADEDDTVAPTVPGQPTATSTVPGRVDLTWAASHDDTASSISYRIYRDVTTAPIGTISSSSSTNVTFSDTGLVGGSVHTYSVSASDGTNTSATSPWSAPVEVAQGPAALFTDDFSGGLAKWQTVVRVTVDDTRAPPSGSLPSARAAVVNLAGYATAALASPATQLCASVSVNVQSLSSSSLSLIRLRTGTNASVGRTYVTSSGTLAVRSDVTGTVLATTRVMTFNAWHRLRMCGTTGTAGSWQLFLDDQSIGSWTANLGAAPFSRIQIGDSDPKTAVVNFDDVAVL